MPQASEELRKEWNGPNDADALKFLKDAGYRLTGQWTWVPPAGHNPTEKEFSAILFMINEWDYGGLEPMKEM
jgi:hypothetical protein